MEKYELMYILRATLDEEARTAASEELHKILTDNGAILGEVTEWGLRDFAYLIKDEPRGYYVIVKFEANSETLEEFERLTRHNDNVLRYLITVNHE